MMVAKGQVRERGFCRLRKLPFQRHEGGTECGIEEANGSVLVVHSVD